MYASIPKMRITQRYATRSAGIVSFPAASRFKIFGMRWMQRQIQGKPQHLRIPHEPDAEVNSHCDHDGKSQDGVSNPEHVVQDRPRSKRSHNGEGITDRNMRQEVAALPHEKIAAGRAADRAIEVAVKQ